MKTVFIAMMVLIAMALAGCAEMKPVVSEYWDITKNQGVSDTYLRQLDQWTRKSVLYSEFETRAYIVATYASPEFCQAYEKEAARLYAAAPKETEGKASDQVLPPADGEMVFYVYASSQNSDAIDFAKPDSIWKIFLMDDKGGRIDPIDIRHIKKVSPRIEQFYPYVEPYHGKFYTIRFPQQTAPMQGTQKRILVFTGVMGRVEVAWP